MLNQIEKSIRQRESNRFEFFPESECSSGQSSLVVSLKLGSQSAIAFILHISKWAKEQPSCVAPFE